MAIPAAIETKGETKMSSSVISCCDSFLKQFLGRTDQGNVEAAQGPKGSTELRIGLLRRINEVDIGRDRIRLKGDGNV